jgi:predicted secreted hydrolase
VDDEVPPGGLSRAPAGDGPSLSQLLGSDDSRGFRQALQARDFRFPEDHGPHPAFRNEWWYLTGNLDGAGSRRFGFELTFFRFSLAPEQAPSASAWRTRQVYIAHLALTDPLNDKFYVAQRFSRGAVGLAGAQHSPFRVWIDDWSLGENPQPQNAQHESWLVAAEDDEFALQLSLAAKKDPVLNGVDGLSQKSARRGNASYYYSISRIEAEGRIRTGTAVHAVSGLAWLDREWSSSALSPEQVGWDWFALQLSDGTELMFYNIRRTDGSQDEHSAGTWITASGESRYLARDALHLAVRDEWHSPHGGIYPAAWHIEVPAFALELDVVPVMQDQELITTVRYWEGAVDVTGVRAGKAIEGRGYVELTGYAR